MVNIRRNMMQIGHAMAGLVLAFASSVSVATNMPESLKPSDREVLALQSQAIGVQIYTCNARRDDSSAFEWTLKAPEAELFDVSGERIGKHYGGPTWESDDGSKVVGQLKARDNGPDTNAIPWLLLTAKSDSGKGVFAGTTSIQRLDTVGGRAPEDGCDAKQQGKELRVPYAAAYKFFRME
jgi:Protein of unknown function (DUF3455)